jgi:multicomponent K+:H+ antiporter subunit A
MMLALTVSLPLLAALLLCAVPNRARRTSAWLAGGMTAIALASILWHAPDALRGEIWRQSISVLPMLDFALSFRVDAYAFAFALLVLGIGLLIVLYAAFYLSKDDPPARFFAYLMLFMGAMLGMVCSGNLLQLVVYFELTSIASFLLIAFWHQRKDAREGARMALAITGAGGLCLLAAVLLIGHVVGSLELDRVLSDGALIRESPKFGLILGLVLVACFAKSAQFPLHFWLPHAMAAPTPVSAYLHSATMVKAGVFLLGRLHPVFASTDAWFYVVSLTGLATMLLGATVAIFRHDLKGMLAYSTISHLGLITLLFGLGSPLAAVAAVFHILNHAVFKASLFMAAGIIDHETGTRDMRQLGGLYQLLPITGTLAIVASMAMAGVPLLNGFLSKEMFLAETLGLEGRGWVAWVVPLLATLASVLSMAYSLRFVHDTFFNGPTRSEIKHAHEPPRFMRVPVEVLVLICLAVGIAPAWVIGPLLAAASEAVLGMPPPPYSLAIWHGFNLPLLMSAIALLGGAALYFVLQRKRNLHSALPREVDGRLLFQRSYTLLKRGARFLSTPFMQFSLQSQLRVLLLLILVFAAYPLIRLGMGLSLESMQTGSISLAELSLLALCALLSVLTVRFYQQRLAALLLLGGVGLLVALIFVHLSAPDLALTQLLVEMVTIVLMMLALNWLPASSPKEPSRAAKWGDGALAIGLGLGAALLTFAVISKPFDSISPFFLEQTLPLGGGANAVNVIIVDFRGYDTLGEITVLGIAGLLVYSLLSGLRPKLNPTVSALPNTRASLLLKLMARVLLPFALLLGIYLFLRGHNAPGGGFIAGLVVALALILQWVASSTREAERALPGDFRAWVAGGLLIAGLTGVGSFFLGAPFLTSTYDYPDLPVLGPIPLASAALFDLGVFATVIGATMVILLALSRLRAQKLGPEVSGREQADA